MGKVPKMKSRALSQHSRAARRAEEPSIPIGDFDAADKGDKSKSGVLGANHGGAISKKKKQKPLTREQRLRREKAMAKAEAVMDRTETKVDKSKGKGRRVQGRRAAWEELNDTKPSKKAGETQHSTADEAMQDAEAEMQPETDQQTENNAASIEMDGVS